jgi:hypothetical protein
MNKFYFPFYLVVKHSSRKNWVQHDSTITTMNIPAFAEKFYPSTHLASAPRNLKNNSQEVMKHSKGLSKQ